MDSEDEPPLTTEKGKKKEVDSTPTPASPAPQKFAGLRNKIFSSLDNMFPGDDGCDQGNYDYLSRGETNLVSPSDTSVPASLD